MTPSDERDLVERARGGDSGAFGQIYQSYVDRVYSFVLYQVRESGTAEDLTQEVFMQAMRGLAAMEWRGSLAPWLLRIARNTVYDHWRRQARRPERVLSAAELGEDDEEAESRLDRLAARPHEEDEALYLVELSVDREQIARAMKQLTDLQQQVLLLRFGSGLSILETAAAMERSDGAIKNLQHHAVRALRKALAWPELSEEGP
ncbi:MAG: sigma-70 family RNA polymerase sigma factor [Ardenticatenia bacterium]|nr:sigma-70 family RNA polymerase sigma factor [Ardenticatenia bacterium]